jgi:large subunit ribosomal protein L3
MAGQMGGKQVTALNLQVISADPERQLVLVKGAVPGARGTVVVLRDSVKAITKPGGSR